MSDGATGDRWLFVSHEASRSGAPLLLLEFLNWLRRTGDDRFDILLLRDGPLRPDFEALGETYLADQLSGRSNRLARVLHRALRRSSDDWIERGCRRLLRRRRYRAVYGNTVVSLPWLETMRQLSGCPCVCHVHEMAWAIGVFFEPDAFARTIARMDAVVACSELTAVDLRDRFGVAARSITVAESFVDPDAVAVDVSRTATRGELGFSDTAIVLAGVGRAELRKGIDLLVQLLAALVRRGTRHDFRALWIGASPSDEIYSIVRHDLRHMGLEDRFVMVDRTPRPLDYLAASDVFAMVSREEPMGLAGAEAICLDKPLVAFEGASGIGELVGMVGGLRVPYLDIEALADAVLEIVERPDATAARVAMARRCVRERLDLERVGPVLRGVLEGVNPCLAATNTAVAQCPSRMSG